MIGFWAGMLVGTGLVLATFPAVFLTINWLLESDMSAALKALLVTLIGVAMAAAGFALT
jgi:hypothetical protein